MSSEGIQQNAVDENELKKRGMLKSVYYIRKFRCGNSLLI